MHGQQNFKILNYVQNCDFGQSVQSVPWFIYLFLLLHRTIWYHQSPSFTNRYTLDHSYKPPKFTLKLKFKLLLHVSMYDHLKESRYKCWLRTPVWLYIGQTGSPRRHSSVETDTWA